MTDTARRTFGLAGGPAADDRPAAPAADAAGLMDLLLGTAKLQVLHAVADLHVPDYLAGGPRSAEEVAALAGSQPRATYRLLRAAASLGVLRYEGSRAFGLTGLGQLLRDGVPGSLRDLALAFTGRSHWQSWGLFPDAVRQGTSQARRVLGSDVFDYLASPENLAEARTFAAAMANMSALQVKGVLAGLDVTGLSEVVDVGGADGQFVLELLAASPGLRGQVLDLPHAVGGARAEAARRGLSARFTAVAGDFFTAVPAADLYLIKTVLHDWDDGRCVTILRNCRSAAPAGGRAVVVETVVGAPGTPGDFAALSDMVMLSVTGGIERELAEFDGLFAASGWHRGRTYPVGGGYCAMELSAA